MDCRVRYIKEREAFQAAEKRQICLQMVIESGKPGQARINVGKSDHRRRTGGAIEEYRELIHEIAHRRFTARTAFVSLCGERLSRDTKNVRVISGLFRFSFQIVESEILENEIQEQKPCADKVDGMSVASWKALLADAPVHGPREQVVNTADRIIFAPSDMAAPFKFRDKVMGTVPPFSPGEGEELAGHEVTGVDRHKIEKSRFIGGISETLDGGNILIV